MPVDEDEVLCVRLGMWASFELLMAIAIVRDERGMAFVSDYSGSKHTGGAGTVPLGVTCCP